MPRVGESRVLLTIGVVMAGIAFITVIGPPAGAVMQPAPIRLSLMFDRLPWTALPLRPLPIPISGHILVRWES